MGGDGAGLWTRLLDDPPEEIDGQWRAISARDLYEAGYAPQGAPKPSISTWSHTNVTTIPHGAEST